MGQPLTGPLVGQHILVTRPAGQAAKLVAGIEGLGGRATHIPFLAINPVADHRAIEEIASRLTDYQACVFVSANAVQSAWPTLTDQRPWPEKLTAAVVGPGTAKVLRQLGVKQIQQPEAQFDSEGLLALPFFAHEHCKRQRFALIRGVGGRDLIASALRERGALVDEASVYERSLDSRAVADMQQLLGAERTMQDRPSAMIITSSESLQRFMMAAPEELGQAIRQLSIIAPHERIVQEAYGLGFEQVRLCDGGDDGILNFLQTYNE